MKDSAYDGIHCFETKFHLFEDWSSQLSSIIVFKDHPHGDTPTSQNPLPYSWAKFAIFPIWPEP